MALELAKSGLRASHGDAPSIGRENIVDPTRTGVTTRYVRNPSSDGAGMELPATSCVTVCYV